MENLNLSTKVITGKGRFSYLHVWEPSAINPESTDKKYSLSFIWPKEDALTTKKMQEAIHNAIEIGKAKWGGKIPPKIKTPIRDGDEDRPDDEAYRGCYFVNATSKTAPGVIDKAKNEIIDKSELYSGCYGRLSVNMYVFDTNGNRGVACGLNNIQKLADGEPLGGRIPAADDFADVPDDFGGML